MQLKVPCEQARPIVRGVHDPPQRRGSHRGHEAECGTIFGRRVQFNAGVDSCLLLRVAVYSTEAGRNKRGTIALRLAFITLLESAESFQFLLDIYEIYLVLGKLEHVVDEVVGQISASVLPLSESVSEEGEAVVGECKLSTS